MDLMTDVRKDEWKDKWMVFHVQSIINAKFPENMQWQRSTFLHTEQGSKEGRSLLMYHLVTLSVQQRSNIPPEI